MGHQRTMRRFARWHVWLGWAIGLPLLMWTATGLVMVARPIEQVRGDHLRSEQPTLPLPGDTTYAIALPPVSSDQVESVTIRMQDTTPVIILSMIDGRMARYSLQGVQLPPLNEVAAKALVAREIAGGERQVSATLYPASDPPSDFRRPVPVWRIVLADGTYVYVGQQSGTIEAVRTRYWRFFDLAWGMHIMDLSDREDTSHPVLTGFTVLAVLGTLLGIILLFRRRRGRGHG